MKTFLAVLAGIALCLIAVILYGAELNLQKATSAPASITQGAPSAPRYSNAAGKADAQARYYSCVSTVETDYREFLGNRMQPREELPFPARTQSSDVIRMREKR